jgi:hypothetical protein
LQPVDSFFEGFVSHAWQKKPRIMQMSRIRSTRRGRHS